MSWLVSGWPLARSGALYGWVVRVYAALRDMNSRYPFLAYGYDWLAFAHLVIAVAFIGPLRDPVRNKWVMEFRLYPVNGECKKTRSSGPSGKNNLSNLPNTY
jgi:hypothetical protein